MGGHTVAPHGHLGDLMSLFFNFRRREVSKNYLIHKQCRCWDSFIELFNSYELQMLFVTSVDLVKMTICLLLLACLVCMYYYLVCLGALRCKPEGRVFDALCCHWNFSLTSSFRPPCGPGGRLSL
jgi:hypothetical protein